MPECLDKSGCGQVMSLQLLTQHSSDETSPAPPATLLGIYYGNHATTKLKSALHSRLEVEWTRRQQAFASMSIHSPSEKGLFSPLPRSYTAAMKC